ncbi:YWFCY domain-containing protein [Filimonas effusa]|uniref:Conjugal transfer protein TraG n=1 Tax=Filimonas effusa TaxID=2508721 RepID=A0A4Q1D2G2_9BACT|nr:YWFCY domain-containing protein [Filimonas effusa]RXK81271.1 conjugal transfer protein TraG [Filimonas effusa]
MKNNTNDIGLKKIIELTRAISIIVLLIHFYFYCYGAFKEWHLTASLSDRILDNISKAGLFSSFHKSKFASLAFLLLSLLGAQGRKSEKINYQTALAFLITGTLLYFISALALLITGYAVIAGILYMSVTAAGYILILTGGTLLTRIIKQKLKGDIFNKDNQSFPQEERLLENKYSFNFPAQYNLKGKQRQSHVSIVNPFRNILLEGLPGSGKTLWVVMEIIRQAIYKGYGLCIHDFKAPDLTAFAYNYYLQYKHLYKVEPEFHVLNFDEIQQRCNPLMKESMRDITDAASASRTILLALNPEWQEKTDFWAESSINLFTCIIWFLRLYKGGKYCTLPHSIEMAQTDFDVLFSILSAEPQLQAMVKPFTQAMKEDAGKQLVGQVSGALIGLSKLATPNLYYVLSGDDFAMTINDPKAPKIVCIANNPQKASIYSPIISLYLNNLQKLLKEQEDQPCAIMLEEFANISWPYLDKFLAVCRSYLVSVTMVIQDSSQLVAAYGKQQADVILNIVGNIISGQVAGQGAKDLSERFGKIMQDRESLAINSSDTSITRSKQLDYAIPQSVISTLSAGEFVGVVADNPDQRIDLKMFHSNFTLDSGRIKKADYQQLPKKNISSAIILDTFLQIKKDGKLIRESEMERLVNTPELNEFIITRK